MQDVSTRRSLSTAEYKMRSNHEVIGYIKEEVTSDEVSSYEKMNGDLFPTIGGLAPPDHNGAA